MSDFCLITPYFFILFQKCSVTFHWNWIWQIVFFLALWPWKWRNTLNKQKTKFALTSNIQKVTWALAFRSSERFDNTHNLTAFYLKFYFYLLYLSKQLLVSLQQLQSYSFPVSFFWAKVICETFWVSQCIWTLGSHSISSKAFQCFAQGNTGKEVFHVDHMITVIQGRMA